MGDASIHVAEVNLARSAEELSRMLKANERRKARHEPVTVSLQRAADGNLDLNCPHDDGRGWQIRLSDAFGTRSDTFAIGQLNNLLGMVRPDERALEIEANTMLAAVEAVRPENELEGMLAVQMAATHRLAMECLQRAACAATPEQAAANGNLATKMLRTYTAQLEALAKLRRGGEQKVTVEHVHVYEGGQAIVGNVDASGRSEAKPGGSCENGQQPHATDEDRTAVVAGSGPLRSKDPIRNPVPVASGEGEEAVPDARRGDRKRGSER
ncbi:hypothetical protein [Methylobacterium sp. PvR107]|uniref:hypothetical protein n=1 Tax=Methylobacterium sp. PvR107 TaxID=2806597 RepID=UPI001AE886DF|nr:hypothetical protein [Methylobacterium sp. PvR107]MBP1184196.1 hypothetical protein [Methylobacterium sp. PvR107]